MCYLVSMYLHSYLVRLVTLFVVCWFDARVCDAINIRSASHEADRTRIPSCWVGLSRTGAKWFSTLAPEPCGVMWVFSRRSPGSPPWGNGLASACIGCRRDDRLRPWVARCYSRSEGACSPVWSPRASRATCSRLQGCVIVFGTGARRPPVCCGMASEPGIGLDKRPVTGSRWGPE